MHKLQINVHFKVAKLNVNPFVLSLSQSIFGLALASIGECFGTPSLQFAGKDSPDWNVCVRHALEGRYKKQDRDFQFASVFKYTYL